MGDKIDFDAYRKKIQDTVETKEAENDSLTECKHCGDLLCMLAFVPDHTDVDSGGPYAIICQHCSEPLGSAFLFEED